MTKKILVFGDSLFEGLTFEDSLEFIYHVESYPGFQASEMEAYLKLSLKEDHYDVVILCFGINDLGHGKLPQEVVDSLLKQHLLIRTKIVAMHLHSDFDVFNYLHGNQSADNVQFCGFFYDLEEGDLLEDNFHLSVQGRQHLSDYLQDFIENEST